MIKLEDLSELGYGGVVTGLATLDAKRVSEGTLDPKQVYKSASFWGYLVPGAVCTGLNVAGKLKKHDAITERVMHGFIYDFTRFIKNTVEVVKGTPVATSSGGSVVQEAERLLAQRKVAAARQLTPGAGSFVSPGVYVQEEQIMA